MLKVPERLPLRNSGVTVSTKAEQVISGQTVNSQGRDQSCGIGLELNGIRIGRSRNGYAAGCNAVIRHDNRRESGASPGDPIVMTGLPGVKSWTQKCLERLIGQSQLRPCSEIQRDEM